MTERDSRMQTAVPRVKLTYQDLLRMPDDGMRHELIDGEHFVTPSPASAHQFVVGNLYLVIGTYLRAEPRGALLLAPFDVVISPHDVVVPDLVYIAGPRVGEVLTPAHASGAPDLAIEVLSPSTRRRDEGAKRALYERAGVGEYWLVHPKRQAIVVNRGVTGPKGDTRYEQVVELLVSDDGALTTPLFPGLELRLAEIFAQPWLL